MPGERDVVLSSRFFSSYAKPADYVAERVGFEPTNGGEPVTRFRVVRIRPLCHLSANFVLAPPA